MFSEYNAIYRKVEPKVRGYVYHHLYAQIGEEREDVITGAITRHWKWWLRQPPQTPEDEILSKSLYFAEKECLSCLKRYYKRKDGQPLSLDEMVQLDEGEGDARIDLLSAHKSDPWFTCEFRSAFAEMLRSLKPRERKLLVMSIKGSSYEDMVKALGLKVSDVRRILHKARVKARQWFKDNFFT